MTHQPLKIGDLSAIYHPSEDNRVLVLAHGAGAGHDHHHMSSIAEALAQVGIGTLRFNFPFIEAGKKRVDSQTVSTETISTALAFASELAPDQQLYLGGHSFGGRMSSHLAAEATLPIHGLVFFSFPLHIAKKPDIKRAAHLPTIKLPMLFLSGTRDALAEPPLLTQVVEPLPNASLHWLDTADHSFKILKRTRTSSEDVYDEAARVANQWMSQQP